jgi:hypothetical protein
MAFSTKRIELRPELELDRIISLPQAAEMRGVSVDTLKRRNPEIIVRLSPRRVGVRVRDVLTIGRPVA